MLDSRTSHKLVKLLPLLVIVVVGVLYLDTCAKDLTSKHNAHDSGDLITAAHILGIAHPTGYPVLTLVGHLFTRIDFSVFSRYPLPWDNSAFKMTLMVVLTSLLNLWIFARIHLKLLRISGLRISGTAMGYLAVSISTFFLGVTYLYWSQSIVPEVYILNLLFIDLVLLIIISFWDELAGPPGRMRWFLLGLAIGSGVFHHLSFVMAIPGFVILILASKIRPDWRSVFASAKGFLLAALPILYFPIRSAANPPLDTSNPETLHNLFRHITGKAYHDYLFAEPIASLKSHLSQVDLWDQFGAPGYILLMIGMAGCVVVRSRLPKYFLASVVLSLLAFWIYAANYAVSDRNVFFLPVYFFCAHLIAYGVSLVVNIFYIRCKAVNLRGIFPVLIIILLGAIWIGGLLSKADDRNIGVRYYHSGSPYGPWVLEEIEPNAIIVTWFDGHAYSLIYQRYVLFPDVRDDVDIILLQQIQAGWWRENVEDGNPNIKVTIKYPASRKAIVENIIRNNIDDRPIYTTWAPLPIPQDFITVRASRYHKIIRLRDYKPPVKPWVPPNAQTDQDLRSNDSSGTTNSM